MRAIIELVKNTQVACKSNAHIKDNFLKGLWKGLWKGLLKTTGDESLMKMHRIFDDYAVC